MSTIAIVYGSTTGNTADAAKLIQKALDADLFEIGAADVSILASYSHYVFGTSTWGYGELQDDWDCRRQILQQLSLKGKTVALFGMGDQLSYTDTYLNGMGEIYKDVTALGAIVVGFWTTEGYEHTESTAVRDSNFVGLALDQDNQSGKTQARIASWCSELKKSFN